MLPKKWSDIQVNFLERPAITERLTDKENRHRDDGSMTGLGRKAIILHPECAEALVDIKTPDLDIDDPQLRERLE
jgi:hypothetical protein